MDALAALSDRELDERFVEAERNALEWVGMPGRHAEHQSARWMAIAAACRTELERRAANPALGKPHTPTPRELRIAEIVAQLGGTPNAPATCIALADKAASTPFALPPSYEQFLRVHDGVASVYGAGGDLLGTAYRGERDGDWSAFARRTGGRALLYVAMDRDSRVAALDPLAANARGDMQVVEQRGADVIRHRTFFEFLETLVTRRNRRRRR